MKRLKTAALIGLLGILSTGCQAWGLKGPQSTVDPDGPVAAFQYWTFLVSFYVSLLIFVCVGTLIVYCVVRFRVPGAEVHPDTPLPDQSHGSTKLEIGLIIMSIGLVIVILVPALQGQFYQGTLQDREEDVLVCKVTAYQWWWKFEYPALGVVTANELAIPTGKAVKFELYTNDVIHAFWVPRLGGKMDVMPNQHNWMWLRAVEAGEYYGQCTEFCGESHAFMKFRVHALGRDDFNAWVEHQKSGAREVTDPLAVRGRDLFKTKQCVGCHQIRPAPGGNVAPDLTHLASRGTIAAGLLDNTPENLAEWLSHPGEIKPGNMMEAAFLHPQPLPGWRRPWPGWDNLNIALNSGDIDALVAYLRSLE